jgi:hypothetical protein
MILLDALLTKSSLFFSERIGFTEALAAGRLFG